MPAAVKTAKGETTEGLAAWQSGDVAAVMREIGRRAQAAARPLALATAEQKDCALAAMAEAIRMRKGEILNANTDDVREAKDGRATPAFIDRLALDDARVGAMAKSLRRKCSTAWSTSSRSLTAWGLPVTS